MWLDIPCRIKYKSSLGQRAVYNYAMSYLIVLMITSSEVLDDSKNNKINS